MQKEKNSYLFTYICGIKKFQSALNNFFKENFKVQLKLPEVEQDPDVWLHYTKKTKEKHNLFSFPRLFYEPTCKLYVAI